MTTHRTIAEQVVRAWPTWRGSMERLVRSIGCVDFDRQDGARVYFFSDGSRLITRGYGRHWQVWTLPPLAM